MIKIYSNKMCASCKQLYKYLESKNIEFTIVDIDDNIKEAIDNKIKCLPTIIYNDYKIEGFNKQKLMEIGI